MKDKITEKVLELYENGVKQAVIAETLNIPKWKVSRIVNKKTAPDSEIENDYTDEDYEVYEETLNRSDANDIPPNDLTEGNPDTPGKATEVVSARDETPDNSSEEDPPAIPDNSSEEVLPDQMRAIAEMTSAETARKMTESYKEITDLMGSVTREIMENSMSGMDKATRMLLTASDRLNATSEKQEKMLASYSGSVPEGSGNNILFLPAALLLLFAAFSFGGICGICDMLYVAVFLCGVLISATVVLTVFYLCPSGRKMSIAFSTLSVAAAIPALVSGYFFFLIEKNVMSIWLYALTGLPVGCIGCLLYFVRKHKDPK